MEVLTPWAAMEGVEVGVGSAEGTAGIVVGAALPPVQKEKAAVVDCVGSSADTLQEHCVNGAFAVSPVIYHRCRNPLAGHLATVARGYDLEACLVDQDERTCLEAPLESLAKSYGGPAHKLGSPAFCRL